MGIQDRDWYRDSYKDQRRKEKRTVIRNRYIGYCAVLVIIGLVYLL